MMLEGASEEWRGIHMPRIEDSENYISELQEQGSCQRDHATGSKKFKQCLWRTVEKYRTCANEEFLRLTGCNGIPLSEGTCALFASKSNSLKPQS